MIEGEKRVVERILGRRKLKSSYEYEVQWVGKGPDKNVWMPRDDLVGGGSRTGCVLVLPAVACLHALLTCTRPSEKYGIWFYVFTDPLILHLLPTSCRSAWALRRWWWRLTPRRLPPPV